MEKLKEKSPALLEKYYSKILGSSTTVIVLKALAGFTCAMAEIFGRSSPLGIAITASDTTTSIYTAIGSAVGYIVGGNEQSMYFAIACVLIGFVNKFIYQSSIINKSFAPILNAVLPPALSAVGTIAVLVLPYIYSNPMMYDIVLWCATLTLAVAFSIFSKTVMNQLNKGTLVGSSSMSLSALYCVCIMGLSAISGFGLSLGRVFGTVSILIAAGGAGIPVATLLGALTGLSLGLSGAEVTMAVTTYTCYGIFSAISAPLGRLAVALAGCGVLAFFDAIPNSQLGSLSIEGILAAAIFFAVPTGKIRSIIHISKTIPPHSLSLIAELKLRKVAEGLRELTSISDDISHKLTAFEPENSNTIYDKIADNICRSCPLALNCWQTSFDSTIDNFNHAISTLKLKGKLAVNDLPKKFSYCTQKEEVCSMMEYLYKKINYGRLQAIVNTRTRGLLNAQIDNLGNILAELSYSIAEIELITSENLELEEVFLSQDLELVALDELMISGIHTIIAQVSSYKDGRYSLSELSEAVGNIMCKLFLPAAVQQVGDIHIIILKEAPRIHLTYSAHQTASEEICGDSYTIFTTENERMYIILSDGMGTGKNAALDSTFTVSLLRRLVSSGLSIATAVELVNAELIVRKGTEATTTVDIAEIHLHSPNVKLFKGGANRSLIYRNGRIISMDSQSLPVGILEKTFLDTDTHDLSPNDLLIMFSDGVGLGDNSWVGAVIEQSSGETEATLAARLAKTAQLRLADDRPDDITVICARVHSFSEA